MLVCAPLLFAVCVVGCKSKKEEASTTPSSSEVAESGAKNGASNVDSSETRAARKPSPRKEHSAKAEKSLQSEDSSKVEKPKPYILKDLSAIKLHPGMRSPKLGDTIYTMSNMPQKTCGEFWVQDSDGYVAMIAQCDDQHEGGH